MGFTRAIFVACIVVSQTACGGAAVVQKRQAENNTAKVQIQGRLDEFRRQCKAEMDIHDLDPIRTKVELVKAGGSPTPFSMLVNTATPTEVEKVALSRWGDLRGRCHELYSQAMTEIQLPPSMPQEFQERFKNGMVQFDGRVEQAINYLIAALYSGQMSYGEFNKQRADTGTQIAGVIQQWLKVMDAEDKQRVLAEAQAAQQQFEAIVNLAHAVGCAKAKGAYAQALCQ
jgi:hypothetical protein